MFILRFIQRVVSVILFAVLCAGAVLTYQGYHMYENGLQRMSLHQMEAQIQSKEEYTTLEEMPQMYLNGVIAVEDKRFYKHPGVDVLAIGRAVVNDIKAGALVEGGSTITQQLAKNMYFDQEKRFSRKIAEVFMAVKMEKEFSKEEILELYLNSIYFGNGYSCVKEASVGYFGKAPSQLNEDECIMLAGIPNAPSVYNPVDNPKLAVQRQQQVRTQMIKAGYLEKEDGPEVLSAAS
ncbi:MAG: biosynthetic peptidoglycan transglycosylase [Blautia sp.]